MRTLRHRIAHALGWYAGRVATFWALFRHGDDKRLMVGFRCDHCGDIDHLHEAPRWMWQGLPSDLEPITPSDARRALEVAEGTRDDTRTPSAEYVNGLRNRGRP